MRKQRVNSKKVKAALSRFENRVKKETGVIAFSGGFARTEIYEYGDEDYFDIELVWGIKNDVQDLESTEDWRLNRRTLKFEEVG